MTEVPENKNVIVILLYSEGVQRFSLRDDKKKNNRKKEPEIHTPFTHAGKKPEIQTWNDIKKFSKTFHTETFFFFFGNGWMDEYKNSV